LVTHPHNLTRLTALQVDDFLHGLTVHLYSTGLFFTSPLVWLPVIPFGIYFLFRAGRKREVLFFICFLLASYLLLTAILIAHPLLFQLRECWDSPYMLPQNMLLLTALLLAISRSLSVMPSAMRKVTGILLPCMTLFIAGNNVMTSSQAWHRLLESDSSKNSFLTKEMMDQNRDRPRSHLPNDCEAEFFLRLEKWRSPKTDE
jgi:hypothetical protein